MGTALHWFVALHVAHSEKHTINLQSVVATPLPTIFSLSNAARMRFWTWVHADSEFNEKELMKVHL